VLRPIDATSDSAPADQQHFESPEEAVSALLAACEQNDTEALMAIFGPGHGDLVETSDPAAERLRRRRFYEAAHAYRSIDPTSENQRTLVVGKKFWPFPIPIVRDEAGWRFDTATGEQEIINRRVGSNELSAIVSCHAYVRAQLQYASKDRDGDEVLEYAQKILSSPGMTDGLYWPVDTQSDEDLSPLGPAVAVARQILPDRHRGEPFMGYYFKVLTRQGKNPPGRRYDYVINDNMIAGFALLAYPADYGSTGVMTFVVSHHGKIWQKDLGRWTSWVGRRMSQYDPDQTWEPVAD